jgi:hypothetical protein
MPMRRRTDAGTYSRASQHGLITDTTTHAPLLWSFSLFGVGEWNSVGGVCGSACVRAHVCANAKIGQRADLDLTHTIIKP